MNFDVNTGLLPAGDYELTLDELRESVLVVGPGTVTAPNWDVTWRRQLVENAGILVKQLWQVGITDIFLDGSFVEMKDHPNDIDGYFNCDVRYLASGDLTRDLNALDPYKIWTWNHSSRRPYKGYLKRQLPMWHRYRVELYPHYDGLLSGITDEFGNELQFPAAFRRARSNGMAKGVIKVAKE